MQRVLAVILVLIAVFATAILATVAPVARAAEAALAGEQLLLAFVVKPAAWRQFGLPAKAIDWLANLAGGRAAVAACLGAPQGLEPLSTAATQICTFSDVPASQQALVERLLASG